MPIVRRGILVALLASAPLAATSLQQTLAAGLHSTVEQVLGFPSPENLVASPVGSTIAWTFNERGVRNVYVADGPDVRAAPPHVVRRGRRAGADAAVVHQRRLDARLRARRRSRIEPPGGGAAQSGRQPGPAEDSDLVGAARGRRAASGRRRRRAGGRARQRARRVRQEPARSGSRRSTERSRRSRRSTRAGPASRRRGRPTAGRWRSCRTGTITASSGCSREGQPVRFIAPSTFRDSLPAWSPDGRRIAFLRQPGAGGAPRAPLATARHAAVVHPDRGRPRGRRRAAVDGGHERPRARGSHPAKPGRHRPAVGRRRRAGLHVVPGRLPAPLLDPASRARRQGRTADAADAGAVHGRAGRR